MSSNIPRKVTGYFDTIAQLVAAEGGQNMVGIVKGGLNAVSGTFNFVTDGSLTADGIDIFAASGSSEPLSFWVRQKGPAQASSAYASGMPRLIASFRLNSVAGAGNLSNAIGATFQSRGGIGLNRISLTTPTDDAKLIYTISPVSATPFEVSHIQISTTDKDFHFTDNAGAPIEGSADVMVWQTSP